MLQERIEELASAILDINENTVSVTGFLFPERLLNYYIDGSDCFSSKGLYPLPDQPLDFSKVKTNALFVILQNGIEQQRIQFNVIKTYTQKYKDQTGKPRTKVVSIRKCDFSNQYNYFAMDEARIFATLDECNDFLAERFGSNVQILESECLV
ncbi:hypothetical protein ACFVR2_07510 [Gottfriedia sp. NPDC057991]|uniref:hypothetical protein n=1 Tax=Gottfriedia sp. NPDC057991 TaxID=3346298 RepID=UPI0036DA6A00